MANFFLDNDDLQFYLGEGADWARLAEVSEYGWRSPGGFRTPGEARAFYLDVAGSIGQLSAEVLAPRAALIDRQDPRLEQGEAVEGAAMREAFAIIREAQLHGLCLPRELGGLQAPLLLYFLGAELMARADVSAMTHFSFHGGMAMAMLVYSIHEGTTEFDTAEARIKKTRFAEQIADIASGAAWGCMDITEPDAGSDMAALRTRATLDAQGQWSLSGQKLFISSGHGKYHFVIARTEAPDHPGDPRAGLGGLSMFLVQAWADLPSGGRERFVTLDRVEEKLGHHGSVTAALNFEAAPAQLIGKRGEGFKYMLMLMNNARLGVSFEAIGLAEAATRLAQAYAAERRSMGKPLAQHELIADLLDEMRTDVQALRALAVAAACHEELAQKLPLMAHFSGLLSEEEKRRLAEDLPRHRASSRRYTPLLKYLAAEKAVEIARRALQIHGGVGYMRDFGVEKLLRDALVLPIYEGTSQIQSLMAMKDTLLGLIKKPAAFVSRLGLARWRSVSAKDPLERKVAKLQLSSLSAQQFLLTRTAAGKLKTLATLPVTSWREVMTRAWDPKRDFSLAMLHAERLTRLLADEAIAELLLVQAQQFPARRELLERWIDRAELRSQSLLAEITTTGARLLATLDAQGLRAG